MANKMRLFVVWYEHNGSCQCTNIRARCAEEVPALIQRRCIAERRPYVTVMAVLDPAITGAYKGEQIVQAVAA